MPPVNYRLNYFLDIWKSLQKRSKLISRTHNRADFGMLGNVLDSILRQSIIQWNNCHIHSIASLEHQNLHPISPRSITLCTEIIPQIQPIHHSQSNFTITTKPSSLSKALLPHSSQISKQPSRMLHPLWTLNNPPLAYAQLVNLSHGSLPPDRISQPTPGFPRCAAESTTNLCKYHKGERKRRLPA